jgi:hypothetical protein
LFVASFAVGAACDDGDVGKRAVAVIVEQDVASPETAKQVIPAVVVIVADAASGLSPCACQARFFGNVAERAVATIFE